MEFFSNIKKIKEELIYYFYYFKFICFGFPDNSFKYYDMVTVSGKNLSFEAFLRNQLPKNFDKWGIRFSSLYKSTDISCMNFFETFAHLYLRTKIDYLPPNFNDWHLKDSNGLTVAHLAAKFNLLPKNFTQWSLSDDNGWTVAHQAAKFGSLPDIIPEDVYYLSDNDNISVFHVLARVNNLPSNFNQWSFKSNNGMSIFQYYLKHHPLNKYINNLNDMVFLSNLYFQLDKKDSYIGNFKKSVSPLLGDSLFIDEDSLTSCVDGVWVIDIYMNIINQLRDKCNSKEIDYIYNYLKNKNIAIKEKLMYQSEEKIKNEDEEDNYIFDESVFL